MKLGKKNQFELEKISSWFQTGKKNPVHQTRYLKLENWKNPALIDRGLGSFIYYVVVSFMAFSDHVRENEYFALTHPNTLIP